MDLANILNEDDEDIFSIPQIKLNTSPYYEFDEFSVLNSSSKFSNYLSMLSLNSCSLNSKYEEFKDFLSDLKNPFSIVGLQEVWSLSRAYHFEGYHKIIHKTRDSLLGSRNANCGGGIAFLISQNLAVTELEIPN